MNKFGRYLSQRREELGIKASDLARLMGYSTVHIRDVELGRRNPFKSDVLDRLAKILRVDPRHLERLKAETVGMVEIPVTGPAGAAALQLLKRRKDLTWEESQKIIHILDRG